MLLHHVRAEEDRTHLHDVLGVPRAGRHAHERLVGVLHRRIGDAQVPLADRVVVGLHDVVRAGMERGRHVSELVEHREVGERGIAPDVVEIAQVGRPRHRHEDRAPSAEGHVVRAVAGPVGNLGRDRRHQLPYQSAVQMHPLSTHVSAGRLPVGQSERIAENHADLFQYLQRGRVDPLHLLGRHHLAIGNAAGERRQHAVCPRLPQKAPGGTAPGAATGKCRDAVHDAFREWISVTKGGGRAGAARCAERTGTGGKRPACPGHPEIPGLRRPAGRIPAVGVNSKKPAGLPAEPRHARLADAMPELAKAAADRFGFARNTDFRSRALIGYWPGS